LGREEVSERCPWCGGFLFVTGQLGVDPKTGKVVSGGTAAEMRQVMKNLEVVLRNAGVMFAHVTMARIFLVDFAADYPAVNKIYAEYFAAGRYPARTTVGVTALALGCRVEVDMHQQTWTQSRARGEQTTGEIKRHSVDRGLEQLL